MGNLLTGVAMSTVFLVFLTVQRKKYKISIKLLVVFHILFTITGAFGASLGARLSGLAWSGKRLHMLMLIDSLTLTVFCEIFNKNEEVLGDYLAIPVLAVCATAKVGCITSGCCYGIELFKNNQGNIVRFPSQWFEFLGWIVMILCLFQIERKRQSQGMLWPIALIWFGIFRYFVDFMRDSPDAKIALLLNIPVGRLLSLLVFFDGVIYLFIVLKRKKERNPKCGEFIKAIRGLGSE